MANNSNHINSVVYLKLLDKIKYTTRTICDLVDTIEAVEGRHESNITYTPDNENATATDHSDITRNDSRVKQIIHSLKQHAPFQLRLFLNESVIGRKIFNKDMQRRCIETYYRKKAQLWQQNRVRHHSKPYSIPNSPKAVCKFCKEPYSSLKRDGHMNSCKNLVRMRGEIK